MVIGEAGTVRVMTAAWVRVSPFCKVFGTTKPVRFWLTVWVDTPGTVDKLHAERIVARDRDTNSSLNVFIFALLIAMRFF